MTIRIFEALVTSSQHPSDLITSTTMLHSQPSNYCSGAEDSSLDIEDTFSEDVDLENSVVSDRVESPSLQTIRIPPRTYAPPSPCPSISTTTSELEVEQGEALLKVKRGWVKEEDAEDTLPDPEVVPKKRKTCSAGKRNRNTIVKKQGMKIPHATHFFEKNKLVAGRMAKNPDRGASKSKNKGKRNKKSGIKTYSTRALSI